ncbi:class I SAM-dependent methyltransferase [Paludifilum halophilum]|uniref:SAM-dependent methyltransferase n=1 Tax=Paludifilum halophilum TaxID=1642702 RepID=A0A235B382_9BACL|nr:class I SAM-dependent methyltransferase [Paludifilum halophilum]OYD06701.1 SAM-dependent methyltransferase [Paludifilum halophilum]
MGKIFASTYDLWMGPLERKGLGPIRKHLIRKARGRVLEIGSGTGFNFPYYRGTGKVTAIDPEPAMTKQAKARAEKAHVPIEVITVGGEKLPFPDHSFDTVVGTLVLCTIPDPYKALKEVRRVCRPGGQVLFLEHVRVRQPLLGRIQDGLTPIWKRLCDGCHLNRNPLEPIERAGLKVVRVNRYFREIFLTIEAIHP